MRASWRSVLCLIILVTSWFFLLSCGEDEADSLPAATSTAASTEERLEVTGLFFEPRPTMPDHYQDLGPPTSQFELWDGSSTLLYDRVTGEAIDLGEGSFGRFSPGGTWMGWNAGPPHFEEKEAWVIELSTRARRSLGPGNFILFLDETQALVQVEAGPTRYETIDLVTGERRSSDRRPPQARAAEEVDGLALTTTGQDQYSVVDVARARVLLTFEAFRAALAGPGEIVVATVPEGDNTNIFLVEVATGAATFVASSPITRIANYPLAANEDFVIWTDDYCDYSDPGKTRILDRRTGTITELDQRLWVTLTPDGLIASGAFGAKALIDPATFEYVFVLPERDPQSEAESSGPDVSWSPDYRYVSQGFAGGHGGLCG